jgi:antitoxin ParD1/3/4
MISVTLSQEQQRYLDEKVASGEFASADEVIDAGLRSLREQERAYWDDVNEKVAVAQSQIERGETVDGESFMAHCREQLAAGRPVDVAEFKARSR